MCMVGCVVTGWCGVHQTAKQTVRIVFGRSDCHAKYITAADDIEFADAQLTGFMGKLGHVSLLFLGGASPLAISGDMSSPGGSFAR
jgi:hypothetical protein